MMFLCLVLWNTWKLCSPSMNWLHWSYIFLSTAEICIAASNFECSENQRLWLWLYKAKCLTACEPISLGEASVFCLSTETAILLTHMFLFFNRIQSTSILQSPWIWDFQDPLTGHGRVSTWHYLTSWCFHSSSNRSLPEFAGSSKTRPKQKGQIAHLERGRKIQMDGLLSYIITEAWDTTSTRKP